MADFMITTYGGGEAIYQAFNAIAALTDLTGKGFGVAVMRVMGVLGLVYALSIVYFRGSLAVAGQWFGWYLLCSMLLFAPGPSLWIKDMVSFSEAPKKVDGVPLVLGYVAGGLSEFMSGAAKSIENAMRPGGPDNQYLPYHRTGYLFASRMMARARNFKIVTPEFSDNMDSFVQQCVTFQAMIGQQYTKKTLQESENVWALVRDNAHKLFGFQYVSIGFTGFVTCEEGARRLDGLWNDEYQKAATYYGRHFFSNTQGDVARTQFMKYLPGSYTALKGVAIHESRILQQEMMSNALEEAPRKKAAQLTGRDYALAKATLGQQNFLSTTGEMAGNLLPYLMTVFQCIIYGSFIIIFIIAPLPGGWMKVLSYSKEILLDIFLAHFVYHHQYGHDHLGQLQYRCCYGRVTFDLGQQWVFK